MPSASSGGGPEALLLLRRRLARLLGAEWYRARARPKQPDLLAAWRAALAAALDEGTGQQRDEGAATRRRRRTTGTWTGTAEEEEHEPPPSVLRLLGVQGGRDEGLSSWSGPSGLSSGLAQEVCAALLDLQSRRPLLSGEVLAVLLGHHAVGSVGNSDAHAYHHQQQAAAAPASPLPAAVAECLALCPALPRGAIEAAVAPCCSYCIPSTPPPSSSKRKRSRRVGEEEEDEAAAVGVSAPAVARLLALALEVEPGRLAAPTAAAVVRALARAERGGIASPASARGQGKEKEVDAALLSLVLWLRTLLLRGGRGSPGAAVAGAAVEAAERLVLQLEQQQLDDGEDEDDNEEKGDAIVVTLCAAAAPLLALRALLHAAGQDSGSTSTTSDSHRSSNRLDAALQSLAPHLPPAWRRLLPSPSPAPPSAPSPLASPLAPGLRFPRALDAIRNLMGLAAHDEEEDEEAAAAVAARARSSGGSSKERAAGAAAGGKRRAVAAAPAPCVDFGTALPLEAFAHVLQFLGHRRLGKAASVSHGWRHLLSTSAIIDAAIWRPLYHRLLRTTWRRQQRKRDKLYFKEASLMTASAAEAEHPFRPPCPVAAARCAAAYVWPHHMAKGGGDPSASCSHCGGVLSLSGRKAGVEVTPVPAAKTAAVCLMAGAAAAGARQGAEEAAGEGSDWPSWRALVRRRMETETWFTKRMEKEWRDCRKSKKPISLNGLMTLHSAHACPVVGCGTGISVISQQEHERIHKVQVGIAAYRAGQFGHEKNRK